ncbi:MAG: queuosine precursor transporter [Bacteroidales bacterium]|nr:queuosine precursor transporter [Bacteroidales bacterium]MBQ1708647.1 queuosine precursor transporter [Bacteroidales bacterium]MBQ2599702.1 queuosine precursor transporter [Bacteroidales bacterium]
MSENNKSGQQGLSITFVWLAVTFCVCLVTSNLFVPRLWQVGKLSLQLSGAVVIFPISYIINDLLTEVYGYRRAMQVIWMGFALSAFVAIAAQLVSWLPAPIYPENQAVAANFNSLFGLIPRTTVASLLAFILGSQMNAWVMSRMKVLQQGKGFGWRAILSTLGGELCDSLVFYPLAFLGVMPLGAIFSIILTQVTVKTLYEVLILPLTGVIARRLKQAEGLDTYDYGISYNPFINKIE